MRIGTKSVLFGAHCFFLHPWFVALAWWKLYGFPWNYRLWVAFFVHDLGYIGKPDMDGEEGEQHPFLGARIMSVLFDGYTWKRSGHVTLRITGWTREQPHFTEDGVVIKTVVAETALESITLGEWGKFTLYHSRYLAAAHKVMPSRLCMADKLAIALTSGWLYLPMVRLSGELAEYMDNARISGFIKTTTTPRQWWRAVQFYCHDYAFEHRDGKKDMWTRARTHQRPS